MERRDRADAIGNRRCRAERHRAAHAVALRADLAVLRDRRLLIQPRDERFRIGHVRRLVQRLRERHQLGMGVAALIEAGMLVLIVILVFLQDWRATLVPATTVPVTIIGAFAAMAALGFTINLLTLFAIVLAIGIVVDDAIVVVEGAAQNIEHGHAGQKLQLKRWQLFGPIIGITLVLMSVFLPAAFCRGSRARCIGNSRW